MDDQQLRHDKMCYDQTAELATLTARANKHEQEIREVVERFNAEIKAGSGRDAVLGRIDERTKHLEEAADKAEATANLVIALGQRISALETAINNLGTKLDTMTPRRDFVIVRTQFWAGVGLIVAGFFSLLIYVVTHPAVPGALK